MTGTLKQDQLCKNCGHNFTESFCNKCGQKEAHRITIGHVMHDLVHVFLHADKGILVFIPRLILHPGVIAREFLDGKRKIFNPFQYLILSVGIVLFLLEKSKFYESLQQYNDEQVSTLPGYFHQGISDFNFFIQKYANVITFLTLPVYALFSWLFLKKRGNNYAEHFTIQVFSMSQINTISMLVLLGCIIFKITGFTKIYFSLALTIVCLSLMYKQFYNLKWRTAIGKGIIVYAASYAVQAILMAMGLVIYILILKARHKA